MPSKIIFGITALMLCNACQPSENTAAPQGMQNEAELISCIQTVLKLDEGQWAYMGTIARGNGKFRTFETTSDHKATGLDTWAFSSSGGDVGEEYSGETSYSKLLGTSLIPIEDDELNEEDAVKFTSCKGPDAEGRYEVTREYGLPHMDERRLTVKNMGWYSEHGSYYAEDIIDDTGRIIARRSGVNTPAGE